ncbi:hypothetical protein [Oceanobacillus luteolus]|uniref:Uncharacterized protein n=1 Tax=Oceanobacillus luteolus TaxID=1274358 RepID=A0ABW4HVH3_9BACI
MKKFMHSFKGKITIFGLAIVMVWGAGMAFASTSAGEQLRAWYNGMFGQSVADIEADTEAYVESKLPGLEAEYAALKEQAGVDIDLSRELATGTTLEELIQAKLEHIGEIDGEKQAILAEVGLQFYNVFLDGYFEILRNADAGLEYATNDLTTFTSESGNAAIAQLTSDIEVARDQAVQELEEAIQAAQEELAAELETQEEITSRNLRNQVDWAIDSLTEEVNNVLDALVSQQEELITATAQQLGEEAKAALDAVISRINE